MSRVRVCARVLFVSCVSRDRVVIALVSRSRVRVELVPFLRRTGDVLALVLVSYSRRTGVVLALVFMSCSCLAGDVLTLSRSVVSWMFRVSCSRPVRAVCVVQVLCLRSCSCRARAVQVLVPFLRASYR